MLLPSFGACRSISISSLYVYSREAFLKEYISDSPSSLISYCFVQMKSERRCFFNFAWSNVIGRICDPNKLAQIFT